MIKALTFGGSFFHIYCVRLRNTRMGFCALRGTVTSVQASLSFTLFYLIRPVKSVCFYIVFSQKHFPLLQTLSYDITLAISSKRRVALRLSRLRVGPPMITCQLSYRDITLRSSNIKNIVQFCPSPGQFVLCCFFPRTFFRRVCAWSPKNISGY